MVRTHAFALLLFIVTLCSVSGECLDVCERFCSERKCGAECEGISDPIGLDQCFQGCTETCRADCYEDCAIIRGIIGADSHADSGTDGGASKKNISGNPLDSGDLCYSVCHKYCIFPCSNECAQDKACMMSCYDGCSIECSSECGTSSKAGAEKHWTFEFWAMMGFFALIIMSFGGWFISRSQRKESITLLDEIQEACERNKSSPKALAADLGALRVKVRAEYEANRIDETTFNTLIEMIDRRLQQKK